MIVITINRFLPTVEMTPFCRIMEGLAARSLSVAEAKAPSMGLGVKRSGMSVFFVETLRATSLHNAKNLCENLCAPLW